MAATDNAVIDGLIDRVLPPDRIKALLTEHQKAAAKGRQDNTQGRAALEREARRLRTEIGNLLDAVARKTVDHDDFVRDQISRRKTEIEDITRRQANLARQASVPLTGITNQKIASFSAALAQMLRSGDDKFRQAYVRLLIASIEVHGPEIRLSGSNDVLTAAVANGPKLAVGEVLSFVQEWRPIGDESVNRLSLNLCLVA